MAGVIEVLIVEYPRFGQVRSNISVCGVKVVDKFNGALQVDERVRIGIETAHLMRRRGARSLGNGETQRSVNAATFLEIDGVVVLLHLVRLLAAALAWDGSQERFLQTLKTCAQGFDVVAQNVLLGD